MEQRRLTQRRSGFQTEREHGNPETKIENGSHIEAQNNTRPYISDRWPAKYKWLILALLLTNCSGNDDQLEFERRAYQPPEGITETDRDGGVTGEDTDDWQTAPFFQGLIEIDPAFPNPVQSTDEVIINVWVHTIETRINRLAAYVWFEGGTIHELDFIEEAPLQQAAYRLAFPAQRLARADVAQGLKRVLILDHNDNIISYGDILVE